MNKIIIAVLLFGIFGQDATSLSYNNNKLPEVVNRQIQKEMTTRAINKYLTQSRSTLFNAFSRYERTSTMNVIGSELHPEYQGEDFIYRVLQSDL